MWINSRLRLSSTVHNSLKSFADFKAYMRNIYIRVQNDPVHKWEKLTFIATDDTIFTVLETWPP